MGIDQQQIKADVENLNRVASTGDQQALQKAISSMPFEERKEALDAWQKDIEARHKANPSADLPKLELTYGTDGDGNKNAVTEATIKERPGILNVGGAFAEKAEVYSNAESVGQKIYRKVTETHVEEGKEKQSGVDYANKKLQPQ